MTRIDSLAHSGRYFSQSESDSAGELHEALCLKAALCWATQAGFSVQQPSAHDGWTCNITATMTTLTPAAFISTALFLCQCEIPFEFQMEHKQPIIWVQRIVFFSSSSMTELLCAEAILSASNESPCVFFPFSLSPQLVIRWASHCKWQMSPPM